MPRPTEPPPLEYFADKRPPAGQAELRLQLGSLALHLYDLPAAALSPLKERFAPYAGEKTDRSHVLEVAGYRDTDVVHYIEPPAKPELNPVRIRVEGGSVRYLGYRLAGWFDPHAGHGEILLSEGDYEPAERAIENYIRSAVAWMAVEAGGALVHAASAVHQDRGYLFFGPSGAGKSTLSAGNLRARVVSDDLSLILPGAGGRLELVGSPFRGTYEGGAPVVGRFPLAAGFRLIQADVAEVCDVPRTRVLGELIGNLPFVADSFASRPDLFRNVTEAFGQIPLRHLRFARNDDGYWDAIEAAGL